MHPCVLSDLWFDIFEVARRLLLNIAEWLLYSLNFINFFNFFNFFNIKHRMGFFHRVIDYLSLGHGKLGLLLSLHLLDDDEDGTGLSSIYLYNKFIRKRNEEEEEDEEE